MAKSAKPETVNLTETTKVVGVKIAKGKQHLQVDKVYDVHPLQAQHLIEKGVAKAYTAKKTDSE